MGQQSSALEEAKETTAATPRGGFCCGVGSQQDKASRSRDTVVVEFPDPHQEAAQLSPEVCRKKPKRPESSFGCSTLGLGAVPEVEVFDVAPRTATLRWTCPKGRAPRKIHIDILQMPEVNTQWGNARKAAKEIGFFEAEGGETTFQLPEGTLDRASGPYRAEVSMESGTEDRPYMSSPGLSAPFSTPPEPAGRVSNLVLREDPREHEFSVQWGPPDDDGGSKVVEYEVALQSPPAAGGQGEEFPATPLAQAALETGDPPSEAVEMEAREVLGVCPAGEASPASDATLVTRCMQHFRTEALSHTFSDLPPGSGPYRIEVRACTESAPPGEVSMLHASTAVAAPEVPTGLRARLMPGWPCAGDGGPSTPRGCLDALGASDVDIVRLEFKAPTKDGGRALESYLIYTVEEEAEPDVVDLLGLGTGKPSPAPVCAVAATDACGGGKMTPGCSCACDVAVEPNRAYTFSVEASNGSVRSGPSETAPCVFVPARVPLPPRGPPEVFRVEGGFAAELRWVGLKNAGGMPLLSFKIGVLGPLADRAQEHVDVNNVQREVTVTCTNALTAALDGRGGISWTPPVEVGSHEAVYGARVEGLQASAQYRFLLAASNAVGTGRWSRPSSPVWTPVAAPAAPVNAVATITVDKSQKVMVTITWECGRMQTGSGSIAAFHVALNRMQSASASASAASAADQSVVRERVVATGCTTGRRVSWATELSQAGNYAVEVVAESTAGQRSAAAALTLDVRPEIFPVPDEAPDAPHWAEEPVLVLGPTNEGETQFGDFDPGTWLQALLLWHDSDPNPFSAKAAHRTSPGAPTPLIDVLCCFRKPGSSNAHVATLATGVTASRLQVALPAHIPMSLRLVVRTEQSSAPSSSKKERPAAKVQSEPLLLLMSEGSEHLKPAWELWSRNSPDGQPPRWRELPDLLQTVLEANWLEGLPKVAFEVPPDAEGDTGAIAPGQFELTFGDERQVQHTLRRVGAGGWNSKVRRTVRDGDGEEAAALTIAADDQCVVCMERRRTHAFMHSDTGDGHLAICGSCAEAYRAEVVAGSAPRHVRNCPMCRRPFTSVQRIYS